MKGLPAAALAAAIVVLLVYSAAAPSIGHRDARQSGSSIMLLGGLEGLAPSGTLLVVDEVRGYLPSEVAAVRSFVLGGGRLVVAGIGPSSASLLRGLDLGIEATPFRVFDPDVDEHGEFQLATTGALGLVGQQASKGANVITGSGTAVLVTGPFVWLDRDADGIPDIDEPRGSWAVARLIDAGAGSVLVLGDRESLELGPVGAQLQAWAAERGPLLVDGGHQVGPDPLDAAPLLAGHRPQAGLLAAGILALVAAFVGWRVTVKRETPRRRRRAADPETLEMLAELRA